MYLDAGVALSQKSVMTRFSSVSTYSGFSSSIKSVTAIIASQSQAWNVSMYRQNSFSLNRVSTVVRQNFSSCKSGDNACRLCIELCVSQTTISMG